MIFEKRRPQTIKKNIHTLKKLDFYGFYIEQFYSISDYLKSIEINLEVDKIFRQLIIWPRHPVDRVRVRDSILIA